jgi:hypothetical protein
MDRTERIEAARVMAADGPWESRRRRSEATWSLTQDPKWDHDIYEYREAPKPPPPPLLRPWTADEVPVGSVIRRKCNPGTRLLIVGVKFNDVGETCVYLGGCGAHLDAQALADEWTLWNGAPCGVMVVPGLAGEATHAIRTEGDHT